MACRSLEHTQRDPRTQLSPCLFMLWVKAVFIQCNVHIYNGHCRETPGNGNRSKYTQSKCLWRLLNRAKASKGHQHTRLAFTSPKMLPQLAYFEDHLNQLIVSDGQCPSSDGKLYIHKAVITSALLFTLFLRSKCLIMEKSKKGGRQRILSNTNDP